MENFISWESKQYGTYLKNWRLFWRIPQEMLCDGICTSAMLCRIEAGERHPEKLTRDRLLSRLGESVYDYETYLEKGSYEEWRLRARLLSALDRGDEAAARELLDEYRRGYPGRKQGEEEEDYMLRTRLIRQFMLVMQTELMERAGCPPEDIFPVLREAVCLTIPGIGARFPTEKRLGIQEVNLALEYLTYSYALNTADCPEDIWREYEAILDYLKTPYFHEEIRAQLIPKTAWYWCRFRMEHMRRGWEAGELISEEERELCAVLRMCNRGIECLRRWEGMYFLRELLSLRKEVLSRLCRGWQEKGEAWRAEKLAELRRQTEEWLAMTEQLYERCGVPKQMSNYSYLYREPSVYCLNDVIRTRRQMLGLSREELCEEICSVRTLARIENGKGKPHREIAENLLDVLGLQAELSHVLPETESVEVVRAERKFRKAIRDWKCEEADRQLAWIRERLSVQNRVNRQYLEINESLLDWLQKKIGNGEYLGRLESALEYTLELKRAMESDAPCLDMKEIECLHLMSAVLKKEKDNPYMELLRRVFTDVRQPEEIRNGFLTYELVMTGIASNLGSIGEYDESDEISKRIIRYAVEMQSLREIVQNVHSIMWNQGKRIERGLISGEGFDKAPYLRFCIAASEFCRMTKAEQQIRRELEKYINT